jgi:predicted glutamine amidotransferase
MCRFLLYLGEPLPLELLLCHPINSLVRQSFNSESQTTVNGDGFGVAWYADGIAEPGVFKCITPAWNNRNLMHLSRVTRSGCVLAHVRAASPGMAVTETNNHPFIAGCFAFMHNGGVARFDLLRRPLQQTLTDTAYRVIEGTTDSEHLFALFLDCYRNTDNDDPTESLAEALYKTVQTTLDLARRHRIEGRTTMNLAVSDGTRAAAVRFATGDPAAATTLFCHVGRRYVYENGTCRMVEPDSASGTVIVASERLSGDPGWETVPVNSMVVIDEARRAQIRPLDLHP